MNTVSLLLAWRYVYSRKHERNISWMVVICFSSILVGSFALALVTAIMNGFEQETCKKLQGIHAAISIDAHGESLDWKAIKKVLDKEFPQIVASTPTTSKQVIVTLPGSDDISNVVILRAIDPFTQQQVTTLKQMIEHRSSDNFWQNVISKNMILIGQSLAQNLEAKTGDSVSVLFIPEEGTTRTNALSFDQKDVRIGGTFKTGIDEFDNHIIYCSFAFLEHLFPDSGVTQIDLKLSGNVDEPSIIQQLKNRLHLNVYSWKELYPALVSALKLEKYAMFLILLLIILVASMNIMSLLFTQIVQKRGDIAILKSLGMSNGAVRSIFLGMGMLIASIASISGIIIALLVCFLLKRYPCIKLPDAYYATHLPVSINPQACALIFFTIMVICFIATWLATSKATRITIASVLRFEV